MMEMSLVGLMIVSSMILGNVGAQAPCGTIDTTLEDFEVKSFFTEAPTGFESDLSCSWTLRAVNTANDIAYQITDITLGLDDLLNVYAGTTTSDPNVLVNHTGVASSQNVAGVDSPNILVTFDSGPVVQATRQTFELFFIAGSDRSGAVSCVNQTLTATAESQFLTSPSFPGLYPESQQCSWTISAPESATLELTFVMIDIEEGDSPDVCNFDSLVIYLPGQRDTPELLVCRRNIWVPETHTIANNQVQLDFVGDDSDSFGGFALSYRAILPPPTTTTATPTTEHIPTTNPHGCKHGHQYEEETSSNSDGLSVSVDEDEICNQPAETGRCLAYFRKFTYDAANKTCKEFVYGGCEGNSNRFDTLEDCQAKCLINRLDAGVQPYPDDRTDMQGQVKNDICHLPKETGPCRGLFRRFAYNDMTKRCEEFVYGGCDGNANRFETMMECETQCFANDDEDTCGLPLVTGPCRGAFQKYGYDTVSKACKEFIYGGCRGNGNRFDSMELCENRCEPSSSCDVVSCIIPIIVVVAIVVIAIIIAVVLIQKRRSGSNKKYAPTATTEAGDASELKKVSPDAGEV